MLVKTNSFHYNNNYKRTYEIISGKTQIARPEIQQLQHLELPLADFLVH